MYAWNSACESMSGIHKARWFKAADQTFCSNRGRGLFVGLELVRNQSKRTPATAEAQDVIYR